MIAALLSGAQASSATSLPNPWACDGANGTITCLEFSGYDGTSTWGYPVSNKNNCTNYSAFRLAQNGANNPGNLGNATDWDTNASGYGFTVDNTPAVGSIAQWDTAGYSHPDCGGDCGHVAYVDKVVRNAAGDVTAIWISESNYGADSNRKVITTGSGWPSNFLHIADVAPPPPPPAPEPVLNLLHGDFDGDGAMDIFSTHGHGFYIMSNGSGAWDRTSTSGQKVPNLRLGDFNGDGATDVFSTHGNGFFIMYNGTGSWSKTSTSLQKLPELLAADFDGDGADDIFSTHGVGFYIMYNGSGSWHRTSTSSQNLYV